jgi:hypothetical protein
MKKEVKIKFNAQSKSVVEEVFVHYTFEDKDISENLIKTNDEILDEVKQLHNKASRYARDAALDRQK